MSLVLVCSGFSLEIFQILIILAIHFSLYVFFRLILYVRFSMAQSTSQQGGW